MVKEVPPGLKEMKDALACPQSAQQAKAAAAKLADMFASNALLTADLLASDPVTTASFIFLLGRALAASKSK